MNSTPLATDTERLYTVMSESNSRHSANLHQIPVSTEQAPILATNISVNQETVSEDEKTLLLERFFLKVFICYILLAVIAASLLASVTSDADTAFPLCCIVLGVLLVSGIVLLFIYDIQKKIWRSMTKIQIFLKHTRSLCITTFFVGVAIVQLKNRDHRPSKMSALMVIPLTVSFVLSSIYNLIIKKKTYDGEPFINLLKIVWDLAWLLLALTTSLKLDGLITWGWKTVFFPLWIAYAILITATLVTVSVMLTTLIPLLCCRRKDFSRLLTYVWVNLHSLALCILLPMLVNAVTEACESKADDRNQNLVTILIAVCVYMVALLLFTLVIITPLKTTLRKIAEEMVEGGTSGSSLSPSDSNRRGRVVPLSSRPNPVSIMPISKVPKQKIFAEIPRYLVKVSSTLFKKATAAEIFLNKLDQKKKLGDKGQQSKNIIKVTEGQIEDSQKKENLILNLMSEQSVAPNKGRRKSIEVLMHENGGQSPLSNLQSPGNNSEQIIPGKKPKPKFNLNLSKHKKNQNQDGAPKDFNLDHSFKSEQVDKEEEEGAEAKEVQDLSESRNSNGDNQCTVCFNNDANTVFMPCGHGGICDECAIGIFEKADQCPFCRKEIVQVLEINTKYSKKLKKVMTAWEAEYVSEEDEDHNPSIIGALRNPTDSQSNQTPADNGSINREVGTDIQPPVSPDTDWVIRSQGHSI